MKARINIDWWNPLNKEEVIDNTTREQLLEEAINRISYLVEEGYSSGQLLTEEYKGWWSIEYVNV